MTSTAGPSMEAEICRVGRGVRDWLRELGAPAVLVAGAREAQIAVALQPQAASERGEQARAGTRLRDLLARRFDTADVFLATRPFAPAPELLRAVAGFEPVDLWGLLAAAEEQGELGGVGDGPRLQAELATWRERALAALPLEWVYGPWLTGLRWESWRECANVSLGPEHLGETVHVADGSGLAERGTVWSPNTDETLSVFEVLVQLGHADCELDAELAGIAHPSTRA
ncbi:MAG: hypothetical protein EP330_13765 [Deltaproteobacteria bacterium]|nr:MAG: hypothetical protein EP330_13765 [Deltaproteobacteria bacterium]